VKPGRDIACVAFRIKELVLWPNLKNLSGGLNLSRGLNMVGST